MGDDVSVKYDLERLGPHGFQSLAAALAVRVIGPQVISLGQGRDGGRDMECHGTIVWSPDATLPGEIWEGHTVLQVKHRESTRTPRQDVTWLWDQIRDELEAWASTNSNRGAVPEYFVFITNIRLTPVPGQGGRATIDRKIQQFLEGLEDDSVEHVLPSRERAVARRERLARLARMRRLRKWRIWDGNQIDAFITAYEDVRRAIAGFITPGDVLATVGELSTSLPPEQSDSALLAHARSALMQDRNIYFHEAGGEGPAIPVDKVVIDLPIVIHGSGGVPESSRAIKYTLERGDNILKPEVSVFPRPHHLVVVGAPGNGKTTISRFLVQIYRTALLADATTQLSDTHREIIESTRSAILRLGHETPRHRRWPVRVDLASYAEDCGLSRDESLFQWIVDKVNASSRNRTIHQWVLAKWLKEWPSFVVFDGLDEVTEPAVRQRLIADIQDFVAEAEAERWDALVVVTTRPTGYLDDMPLNLFQRVDLDDLGTEDALAYGRLTTQLRFSNDPERAEAVQRLLEDAAKSDALRTLLRTPLQIAIMSVIAETASRFEPDRYSLFWRYYETINSREQNKKGGLARLLRDQSSDVLALHERVGLELQMSSEAASGATAVMSQQRLRDLAWEVLADSGHEPGSKHASLLRDILVAATHRLVLIAPRGDDGYGFEVRSLQELMAARRITTGSLDQILPRLRLIAPSPHWRNTWLFAAGRYFAEPQPHQRDAISTLVLTIDDDAPERLGRVVPLGPWLAWDIIDDGMAAGKPRWIVPIADHALTILSGPAPRDLMAFTRVLMRAAGDNDVHERIVCALRGALGGNSLARETASRVQESIGSAMKNSRSQDRIAPLIAVRRRPGVRQPTDPAWDWSEFDEQISAFADEGTRVDLQTASGAIRQLSSKSADGSSAIEQLVGSIASREVAEVVEEALTYLAPGSAQLSSNLRDHVVPVLVGKPVSEILQQS